MKKAFLIAIGLVGLIIVLVQTGLIVPKPTGLPGNPANRSTSIR